MEYEDLRTRWPDEAKHFTPWLRQPENLALLGQEIGLSLGPERTEVRVGLFRADILAWDLVMGRTVVIENQLTKSDHSHLGQLLTYGASLDAGVGIWVAPKFADEHLQALDWINRRSGEQLRLHAVAIGLRHNPEGTKSPFFRQVCGPAPVPTPESEFWNAFFDVFDPAVAGLGPCFGKDGNETWRGQYRRFATGSHGLNYRIGLDMQASKPWLCAELNFWGENFQDRYAQLQSHRAEIEAQMPELSALQLKWKEDLHDCKFGVYWEDADFGQHNWLNLHCWLVERLAVLHQVLGPYLPSLGEPI